jgi:hypothetical protein
MRESSSSITSAEALANAQKHVLEKIFGGRTVVDGAQIVFHAYISGQAEWKVQDTWAVYTNRWPEEQELTIRASDVILICKRTGKVLYEGSAGDEG